jgi:thymidylate synthase (FAD)
MGNDLRIANLARQSFGKSNQTFQTGDKGLINRLMKDRHGTPFEGVVFTFSVKAPIFVAREWFRHRIASYSELSGRYSELPPDFYIPELEQIREQKGKAMDYTFAPMELYGADAFQQIMRETCERSFESYHTLLSHGVAKEVARDVLPVNTYTTFSTIINLRSAFNFVSQRSHPSALWEIRQYSQAMELEIAKVVPHAYKAFVDKNRVAP